MWYRNLFVYFIFLDYVFCDSHKTPDAHDCEFDHKEHRKTILTKLNPKIDSKGGQSFQKI